MEALEARIKTFEGYKDALQELGEGFDHVTAMIVKLGSQKRELEAEIEKLSKIRKLDLGKNNEFGALIGKKVETEVGRYTYVIEFFENAYQKEGITQYSLG